MRLIEEGGGGRVVGVFIWEVLDLRFWACLFVVIEGKAWRYSRTWKGVLGNSRSAFNLI